MFSIPNCPDLTVGPWPLTFRCHSNDFLVLSLLMHLLLFTINIDCFSVTVASTGELECMSFIGVFKSCNFTQIKFLSTIVVPIFCDTGASWNDFQTLAERYFLDWLTCALQVGTGWLGEAPWLGKTRKISLLNNYFSLPCETFSSWVV